MSEFAGLPKYALQVKVKGGGEWNSVLYFEEKMSVCDFEYRIFLHNETESSSETTRTVVVNKMTYEEGKEGVNG